MSQHAAKQFHYTVNPRKEDLEYHNVAVPLNNEALLLSKRGDYAGAERLHLRALEVKIRALGTEDIRVAITYNELGETQLRLNKLDEAEVNLRHAVAIRDAHDKLSLDAAVSRENLAQLLEARFKLDQAKAERVRGAPSVCCGNAKCPGQLFKPENMMTCGFCKSVFYCSANCQSMDWTSRHKSLCRVSPRTI
ncbi:hypothetical protein SCHPADRAFT_313675 [Schizopora paradoxa]|uniref:MYND-type domain-containing protein n=1 Tax=Schizopora paradoxa TaxID=27342 RepID=A0A0H2SC50_9AGAM|nr:hypothetical protein SCHPADRAFT_313675 [Schizopora paradoxa]